MTTTSRIRREEALSFLLTYLIVEEGQVFQMNQVTLFQLTNMAAEAEHRINTEDGIIPHEIIEDIAAEFLSSLKS